MTPTTPTKSPVDTIREAMMKVQTVATTTMHRMDHGCVPDPEGETFHALLSAIRAINPSALSSLPTQPAQAEDLDELASTWVRDPDNWGIIDDINNEGLQPMITALAAFARSLNIKPAKTSGL